MPRLNPSIFVCTAMLFGSFGSSPPSASAQLSGSESLGVFIDMKNPVQLMEARSRELVDRLRESDQDAVSKQELRMELSKVLLQQFSEQEAERLRKVEAIEQRIQRIKSVLEMRAQNAERIVDARIAQLLGEPSDLAWDFPIDLPAESAGESNSLRYGSQWSVAEPEGNSPVDSIVESNSLRYGSELSVAEPKSQVLDSLPQFGSLSSDLLLGYGLALSNVNGQKEELAKLTQNLENLEKRVADARSACEKFSQQLTGTKMNDPKLSSEYQESINRLVSFMREAEELSALVQSKKRVIEALELQLLPLSREVQNRTHGEGNLPGR